MPVSLSCPCGKRLTVKDSLMGKRVKCPGCGKVLNAPGAPAEEVDTPRPAPAPSKPPASNGKVDQMGERLHSVEAAPQPVSMLGATIVTIFLLLVGLGLVGLGAFGLFAGLEHGWHGIVMIAIGFPMAGGAIRFWFAQKAKVPQSQVSIGIVLYKNGLIYTEGTSELVVLWSEVELATLAKNEGFFAHMNNQKEVMTIYCKGGKKIVLDDRLDAGHTYLMASYHLPGKTKLVEAE